LTGIVIGSQALMRMPGHAEVWVDGIDALFELVALAVDDAEDRERVLGLVDSWLYEAPDLGIPEEVVAPRRACFVALSGAGPSSFD
jgi:hypothetical protein